MAWKIVGGPRAYETDESVYDVAAGWAWEIESHGVRRIINADISASVPDDVYGMADAEAAVHEVLAEDDPPHRLTLTTSGIVRG